MLDEMLRDSPTLLPPGGSWRAVAAEAVGAAAAALVAKHGADPAGWRWGRWHRQAWRHSLGRDAALARRFDATSAPEHLPMAGDATTLNCTVSLDETDAPGAFGVTYRQILDVADLNRSLVCLPPGNSGHPDSPHYADGLARWRAVEYHPLLVDWGDIEKAAEARLVLTPQPAAARAKAAL